MTTLFSATPELPFLHLQARLLLFGLQPGDYHLRKVSADLSQSYVIAGPQNTVFHPQQ